MITSNRHTAGWHRRLGVVGFLLILVASLVTPQVSAQNAAAQPDTGDGLAGMLSQVPMTLPGLDDSDNVLISYADLGGQLDAAGVEPPADFDSPEMQDWIAATTGLLTPALASQHLAEWRDLFGFDLLQADQTLEISGPPFALTLYRGEFDEQAVRQALEKLGYQPVDVDGAAVYVVRDDYELDLSSPSRFVLATMNVAAILPDGTLAFAPARDIIESVAAVAADASESLAERPDIAALLPHLPGDLVGATLVPGIALRQESVNVADFVDPASTPDVNAMATDIATPNDMPPVILAVLGTTAGDPEAPESSSGETPSGVPLSRSWCRARTTPKRRCP